MVSDTYEDLVKCGYLDMKLPRKHRKLGRQAWKRKWFILRRKSSQGKPRLEYHKSEESCLTSQNKTVVELKTLIKIEEPCKSKTKGNHVFRLVFQDTYIFLAPSNEAQLKEWTRLIRKLVLPESTIPSTLSNPHGTFLVTVICTEDSDRLNLVGDYLLVVTSEHLSLFRADAIYRRSVVALWELDDIPRFRLQKLNHLNDAEKIFIVNLARTSAGCEGEFQFLTKNGREILEAVKSHTKQRSRPADDSPRSTPDVHHHNIPASNVSSMSRSRSVSGRSELSNRSTTPSSKNSAGNDSNSQNLVGGNDNKTCDLIEIT